MLHRVVQSCMLLVQCPLLHTSLVCCPSQVTVTVGAAEGMYNCMQAFVERGDEVVILEPFFDTCAWTRDADLSTPRLRETPRHSSLTRHCCWYWM